MSTKHDDHDDDDTDTGAYSSPALSGATGTPRKKFMNAKTPQGRANLRRAGKMLTTSDNDTKVMASQATRSA